MKFQYTLLCLSGVLLFFASAAAEEACAQEIRLEDLDSPILLQGDKNTGYRDPTAVYHDGVFYLYATVIRTEEENRIYSYTALTRSSNLRDWSQPVDLTPKGQKLNYSSPGNVIRYGDEWIMCLQTYPRPDYRRGTEVHWADQTARLFIMRSSDLVHWSEPELLRVKGPDVPVEAMGRMIDPYLIEDKDEPGKWWCFYKQNGVSMSWSKDLKNWHFFGSTESGENVCVLTENDQYVLIHSPTNGMGVKRSRDLLHWQDTGDLITLGQRDWPWAETRLTAGFVLDLRKEPGIGKYVMVFHGSGPGKKKTQDNVDAYCCIGIAWSDDLKTWQWPGRK